LLNQANNYNFNFSFFIELKHTFFAYSKANNPRKIIHKKFTRALDQLESIKKDKCKQQTIGDGMRKIALEVIVFYRGSKDENILINDLERRDFKLLFEKLLVNSGLKKQSNMRALWVLDKRFGKPIEFAKTYEIYPAVGFIGNVSKIIK